jgi:YcaO-like protein with predicted kinase domain
MTADQSVVSATLLTADDGPKRFTIGGHRTCSPEDTLGRLRPLLVRMGITRIANVTGLDRIGIPVVSAVRPNARSVCVAQGKGLTLAAAKASAVMEAAELWHAEHITSPLKLLTYDEMRREHRVPDVNRFPRNRNGVEPTFPLLWIEGRELMTGEAAWVPFELVSANFTLPVPAGSGCFQTSSSGLGAGNHPLEAICHALCEVVERDATTLWRRSSAADRRSIDLSSVTDADCTRLLDQLVAADLTVRVWETTSDVGVASFCCVVVEASGEFPDPGFGFGCHPAREVALLRALTEAAQVRMTFIAGIRDDHRSASWEEIFRSRRLEGWGIDSDATGPPTSLFAGAPSFMARSLREDLDWLLTRLRTAGFDQVIAVDLTKDEVGLPVTRVVVPGLEGPDDDSAYIPGARARALAGGAP